MNFSITGDGVGVTDALREYAKQKIGHVLRNCDVVPTVNVILKVSPHTSKQERQTASVTISALGKKPIHKSFTGISMYSSIDKIAGQVKKEIGKQKGRSVPVKKLSGVTEVAENFAHRERRVGASPAVYAVERRTASMQI